MRRTAVVLLLLLHFRFPVAIIKKKPKCCGAASSGAGCFLLCPTHFFVACTHTQHTNTDQTVAAAAAAK